MNSRGGCPAPPQPFHFFGSPALPSTLQKGNGNSERATRVLRATFHFLQVSPSVITGPLDPSLTPAAVGPGWGHHQGPTLRMAAASPHAPPSPSFPCAFKDHLEPRSHLCSQPTLPRNRETQATAAPRARWAPRSPFLLPETADCSPPATWPVSCLTCPSPQPFSRAHHMPPGRVSETP